MDSLKRLNLCASASRLIPFAQFIGLLDESKRASAARAVVEVCGAGQEHNGWQALTRTLLGTVPCAEVATIARVIVHPERRLHGSSLKDVVEIISDRLDRVPAHEVRPLVGHLVEIATMHGPFEHLVFSPDECAQMIEDLRATCRRLGFDDLARELNVTLEEICEEYKTTMLD